jgi:hypothetical protein
MRSVGSQVSYTSLYIGCEASRGSPVNLRVKQGVADKESISPFGSIDRTTLFCPLTLKE